MKTLYEQLGGTYREENGRLIPEMKLPEQTNYQIGKYGQFYLDYIKNHRRGRYTTLLTEGTLNAQLHEIDLILCFSHVLLQPLQEVAMFC